MYYTGSNLGTNCPCVTYLRRIIWGTTTLTITHQRLVSNPITELLANRCIVKVTQKPHICSPLSVVTNTEGKLRLFLNLRYLNQFLHKVKFKYEDIRVALLMFNREDLLFKFDLKSGYHHLDIFNPTKST